MVLKLLLSDRLEPLQVETELKASVFHADLLKSRETHIAELKALA